MKYEISKKYFDYVILELIEFTNMCRLCGYIDSQTLRDMYSLLDMLRYYRQFAK